MDNYNGPFKGEEDYYGSQKVRHKSFWQRYRWFVIFTGSLVILLAIFVTSTLYLLTSRTPPPSPFPLQTGSSQTRFANTPIPATSSPGTINTPTTLATVTPATVTEPNGGLRLHTNADDPITVTITSMTYNPGENKMVWDLVLKNVSSSDQNLYGVYFTLKSDAEGDNSTHQAQTNETGPTDIPPGNQIQEMTTFTFVPYQQASGVSYTLTSLMQASGNVAFERITFDSITMTF